jgi:tryptophan synthase beta chain
MRDWVTNVENTFYIIGTVAGPHPYPMMVRDFQRVIGDECLVQMPRHRPPARRGDRLRGRRQQCHGHLLPLHRARQRAPDRRRGGGRGPGQRPPRGVAVSAGSRPACCTATAPTCCRTTTARSPRRTRSRPGLDYPGVGPEHAYLKDIGRAEYVGITDDEALEAFHYLCRTEGIIPALESSHAVAYAMKLAATMRPTSTCWSTCPGAATRTSAPWPTCRAPSSSAGRRAAAGVKGCRVPALGGAQMSRIQPHCWRLKAQAARR